MLVFGELWEIETLSGLRVRLGIIIFGVFNFQSLGESIAFEQHVFIDAMLTIVLCLMTTVSMNPCFFNTGVKHLQAFVLLIYWRGPLMEAERNI